MLGQRFVVENKPGRRRHHRRRYHRERAKGRLQRADDLDRAHGVRGNDQIAELRRGEDFTPVGIFANSAVAVVVQKDFPANDLKGLIEVIKTAPGQYNYATVASAPRSISSPSCSVSAPGCRRRRCRFAPPARW